MTISSPEPLDQRHRLNEFNCGDDDLSSWLIKRARKNEGKFARSFVVCDANHRVTGFYCLAAGTVERSILGKPLQRNAPELIPAIVLGRLAVDVCFQKQGLGTLLLRDAFQRTLHASAIVGTRLMLLHAKNDQVCEYYSRFGFRSLPEHLLTMTLPMETLAQLVETE